MAPTHTVTAGSLRELAMLDRTVAHFLKLSNPMLVHDTHHHASNPLKLNAAQPNFASGVQPPAAQPLVPQHHPLPAVQTPTPAPVGPAPAPSPMPTPMQAPKMARLLKRANAPAPQAPAPPPPPGSFKPSSLLGTITTPDTPQAIWQAGVHGKMVPQAPGFSQEQSAASGQQLQNTIALQKKAGLLEDDFLDELALSTVMTKLADFPGQYGGYGMPAGNGPYGMSGPAPYHIPQGGPGMSPYGGFGQSGYGQPGFGMPQQQRPLRPTSPWEVPMAPRDPRPAMRRQLSRRELYQQHQRQQAAEMGRQIADRQSMGVGPDGRVVGDIDPNAHARQERYQQDLARYHSNQLAPQREELQHHDQHAQQVQDEQQRPQREAEAAQRQQQEAVRQQQEAERQRHAQMQQHAEQTRNAWQQHHAWAGQQHQNIQNFLAQDAAHRQASQPQASPAPVNRGGLTGHIMAAVQAQEGRDGLGSGLTGRLRAAVGHNAPAGDYSGDSLRSNPRFQELMRTNPQQAQAMLQHADHLDSTGMNWDEYNSHLSQQLGPAQAQGQSAQNSNPFANPNGQQGGQFSPVSAPAPAQPQGGGDWGGQQQPQQPTTEGGGDWGGGQQPQPQAAGGQAMGQAVGQAVGVNPFSASPQAGAPPQAPPQQNQQPAAPQAPPATPAAPPPAPSAPAPAAGAGGGNMGAGQPPAPNPGTGASSPGA